MSKICLAATSDEEEGSEASLKSSQPADNDEGSSPPPIDVPVKKGSVKELNPTEIRWFHKSTKTSIWIPFKGRDSILIEVKRRSHLNMPMPEKILSQEKIKNLCQMPIVVLDGYYELFIAEMKIKPIYWEGESVDIMRGTWFIDNDWSPLEDDLASEIEAQHLKMFRGQKVPDSPVYTEKGQRPANTTKIRRCFHTEATFEDGPCPINHVLFVVHGIGQKRQVNQIVINCNEMRLTAERLLKNSFGDFKFRPIFIPVEWRANLKLDEDVIEAITPNQVQFLRSLLNSTAMDIMYYSSPKYRAEVAAGLVAVLNRLYALFLKHNPHFESINGAVSIVAHSLGTVLSYDVITNYSPLVQYEDFVSQRLSALIKSNLFAPDSQQRLRNLENCRKELEEKEGGLLCLLNLAEAKKMQINFKVSNLFCLGSPLSVFLALRGLRGLQIFDNFSPKIFNIFNTSDPVAYRIEPLMHTSYSKVNPLRIHRHDSKQHTPYEEMPIELLKSNVEKCENEKESKKKKSNCTKSPADVTSAVAVTQLTSQVEDRVAEIGRESSSTEAPRRSWSAAVFLKFRQPSGSNGDRPLTTKNLSSNQTAHNADGSKIGDVSNSPDALDHVTESDFLACIPVEDRLPYRLDYALKESKLDVFATMVAHTSYWQKGDVVMFILSQLYGLPTATKN